VFRGKMFVRIWMSLMRLLLSSVLGVVDFRN
jgi:hypothetical protein